MSKRHNKIRSIIARRTRRETHSERLLRSVIDRVADLAPDADPQAAEEVAEEAMRLSHETLDRSQTATGGVRNVRRFG